MLGTLTLLEKADGVIWRKNPKMTKFEDNFRLVEGDNDV
jgi:hypothetical protein